MATLRPLVLEAGPLSGTQLRELVEATFPDLAGPAARAVAWACRNRLDMVQTPPRGVWGKRGQVKTTPLDAWLGRPLDPAPSLDAVILRYLAAFGPSSVADVAAWSRRRPDQRSGGPSKGNPNSGNSTSVSRNELMAVILPSRISGTWMAQGM